MLDIKQISEELEALNKIINVTIQYLYIVQNRIDGLQIDIEPTNEKPDNDSAYLELGE